MTSASYFTKMENERSILRRQGLACWPDQKELAEMLFDLNDKLEALAEAEGLHFVRDCRGRWLVLRGRDA